MDHRDAIQIEAVEKYLLGELSPAQRDDFEDHYFDCLECATELRASSAFMDMARDVFKQGVFPPLSAEDGTKDPKDANKKEGWRLTARFRPLLTPLALAASLLVMVYQNAVVYPRYRSEVARFEAPEVLPSVSLLGANSRGGQAPAVELGSARRVLLQVDIPTEDPYTSYDAVLYSPADKPLWTVNISSQEARDTVTMSAPVDERLTGTYKLVVFGTNRGRNADGNGEAKGKVPGPGVEVARYRFDVTF